MINTLQNSPQLVSVTNSFIDEAPLKDRYKIPRAVPEDQSNEDLTPLTPHMMKSRLNLQQAKDFSEPIVKSPRFEISYPNFNAIPEIKIE